MLHMFHVKPVVAVLLLCRWISLVQSVPMAEAISRRDFSADQRNFNQITQLMHNIRSRIGIPFSALANVGLNSPHMVELSPLDLALLPNGYCFSCDTLSHPAAADSKPVNPFSNQMFELDEQQLIVICADSDAAHGFEWPLMRACPGQEEILKNFLLDLRSRGNRLAVPKTRLEKAPLLELDRYRCMPNDASRTTCSPMPGMSPAMPKISTSVGTKSAMATATVQLDIGAYAASIYKNDRLSRSSSAKPSPTTASRDELGKTAEYAAPSTTQIATSPVLHPQPSSVTLNSSSIRWSPSLSHELPDGDQNPTGRYFTGKFWNATSAGRVGYVTGSKVWQCGSVRTVRNKKSVVKLDVAPTSTSSASITHDINVLKTSVPVVSG